MPNHDVEPIKHVAYDLLADSSARVRFQHDYTLAGFKTLILLQGGAIVALLTYLGHFSDTHAASGLGSAFAWYVGGLVATVLGYLAAYLSQGAVATLDSIEALRLLNIDDERRCKTKFYERSGNGCVIAGIALGVISLVTFVIGSWQAFQALT